MMNLSKIFRREVPQKQSIVVPEREEPKHMHTWSLVARTYAPPVSIQLDVANLQINDSPAFERMVHGVTTLLWECEKCPATRKEEMLGSDEETLDELVKKVRLTGPQYIERNGETFVFNKWVQASVPGTIPIR